LCEVLAAVNSIQNKTEERDYEAKQAIAEAAFELLSELMNRLKTLGVIR
jgi:hypothetical protein